MHSLATYDFAYVAQTKEKKLDAYIDVATGSHNIVIEIGKRTPIDFLLLILLNTTITIVAASITAAAALSSKK